MSTVHATTAQALVRFLMAQKIDTDDGIAPLVPGIFAIFGHGNVTSLGEALEAVQGDFPTWRGHNEQTMAHAAIAFARQRRRRQVMAVTTSIGPGALNLATAAGVAMANRLPVLFLAGDVFVNRIPDPVLQQVEHFDDPSTTVNDAFKPLVRYWDRIVHPAQLIQSLPSAVETLLDPADCGPAFIGLPQDVQAEAFDWPIEFFEQRVHKIRRPRADPAEISAAARELSEAKAPLIIAGGGIRYAEAESELVSLAEAHNIPIAETVAGKGSVAWEHPLAVGPIGVIGSTSANRVAAEADVVVAVGTRLQDFTTGSWSVFENPRMRLLAINTNRFDAAKHRATRVVADAKAALEELNAALGSWRAPVEWTDRASALASEWNSYVSGVTALDAPSDSGYPSYAQVIGVVNRWATAEDYIVAAAGGIPGELNKTWRAPAPASMDCEYGFSCMGYEIGGAWGAAMALEGHGDVVTMCGDGSYLMANSDVYSSVLSGHKMIMVLCDNGGYAVIQRLQESVGGEPFNNRYDEGTKRASKTEVDYVAHAASMGALTEEVEDLEGLATALENARSNDTTTVIVIRTDPSTWTAGDAWWDVGVPETSDKASVKAAKAEHELARRRQRLGI